MLTVLYHADADGFGAAWAIWKNLEAEARDDSVFIPVQYGEELPLIDARTQKLMIVDFSYSRWVCDELALKYVLVVIDHHESAQRELKGAEYAVFDMDQAGCVLTWKYMTDAPVPDLLLFVQDRDLWRWELPGSQEVNTYISAMPNDFVVWNSFDLETALIAGEMICAFRDRQVARVVKSAVVSLGEKGLQVVSVNCAENVGEVGEALLDEFPGADYASVWRVKLSSEKIINSLRSRKGGVNVAEIAELFGGGGHCNAAGYAVGFDE